MACFQSVLRWGTLMSASSWAFDLIELKSDDLRRNRLRSGRRRSLGCFSRAEDGINAHLAQPLVFQLGPEGS
jgi:hypothetical protein